MLFVSSKVENRIAALEKAGKSGKNLAKKAIGIIDGLASGNARNPMNSVQSTTKYGEKRIRNCRKYDLGGGYRMIILQRGETVFIPFLGSHDESQRWLENNSRRKVFHGGKGRTIQIEDHNASPANFADAEKMNGDEEVDLFSQTLTDRELRAVFNGLVEGAGKGPG